MKFLFFLFFAVVAGYPQGEIPSIGLMSIEELCSESSTMDYETTSSILLDWCSSDTMCSAEILLDARGNITVFKYFSDHTIKKFNGDLFYPFKKSLCQYTSSSDTPGTFIRSNTMIHLAPLTDVWMFALIAFKTANQLQCDQNHRLVVHRDTLTSSCECLPTSNCETTNDSLLFFIVLAAILILALLVLIAIQSYTIYLKSAEYKKKFE